MAKNINADALTKRIDDELCKPCRDGKQDYSGVRCRACWVDDMLIWIDSEPEGRPNHCKLMPTTDVREVMHSAWIPVTERLPDEDGDYFATYINHDPEVYYEHIKGVPLTAPVVYFHGTWFWWSSVCLDILKEYGENHVDEVDGAIEIIAWMPLPESFKP